MMLAATDDPQQFGLPAQTISPITTVLTSRNAVSLIKFQHHSALEPRCRPIRVTSIKPAQRPIQ
jgi:hypothetical protein